jgi:hypothetical protein
MPAIIAIKSGNWNDPTVWHLGRIPGATDAVFANGFTVNINVNSTIERLSNLPSFGLSAVPVMTDYTTPSGIASAQNEYDLVNYQAWKAFDGTVTNTFNHWIGRNGRVLPEWLQYEFASPKVIIGYSLQTTVYDVNRATDWEFQAWNGTVWVVLDTNVGSPSQAVPYVRTFTNTTSYSRYRIFITNSLSSSYLSIGELRLFETATDAQNATAGGGFILNPNITLTCTERIESSINPILTWNGGAGTTSTVISPLLLGSYDNTTFVINGLGTLNLNIAISSNPSLTTTGDSHLYEIFTAATINLVGSIITQDFNTQNSRSLWFRSTAGGATINITGNIIQHPNRNHNVFIDSNITYNQTGNLEFGQGTWPFQVNTTCLINITGSLTLKNNQLGFVTGASIIFTLVGPIVTETNGCALYSVNTSAVHFFSGPFIHSPYGYSPLFVPRYNLIPNVNSYVDFPDSTTNGQFLPTAPAPRVRFISPSASSDSPDPEDVRLGVSYAFSSSTGTLNMPHPNQVTYGVAVDNTFGNAVLTAASVWDYLVASITVENSIGMRLKNVATPQTVGAQLASLL